MVRDGPQRRPPDRQHGRLRPDRSRGGLADRADRPPGLPQRPQGLSLRRHLPPKPDATHQGDEEPGGRPPEPRGHVRLTGEGRRRAPPAGPTPVEEGPEKGHEYGVAKTDRLPRLPPDDEPDQGRREGGRSEVAVP